MPIGQDSHRMWGTGFLIVKDLVNLVELAEALALLGGGGGGGGTPVPAPIATVDVDLDNDGDPDVRVTIDDIPEDEDE